MQLKGNQIEVDARLCYGLPNNESLNSVKRTLPEGLRVSDVTDEERQLLTSAFVTKIAKEPYCREAANTEDKQRSVYSYDRNFVLPRQARIICGLQKVIANSKSVYIL